VAAWIKLSASEDGSFSITNGRTGWIKNYERRRAAVPQKERKPSGLP